MFIAHYPTLVTPALLLLYCCHISSYVIRRYHQYVFFFRYCFVDTEEIVIQLWASWLRYGGESQQVTLVIDHSRTLKVMFSSLLLFLSGCLFVCWQHCRKSLDMHAEQIKNADSCVLQSAGIWLGYPTITFAQSQRHKGLTPLLISILDIASTQLSSVFFQKHMEVWMVDDIKIHSSVSFTKVHCSWCTLVVNTTAQLRLKLGSKHGDLGTQPSPGTS